jgi:serine/threonine protein kinase
MATVFKAYHAALDRYVAIKVLHPAFKEDPSFLARFQREARVVAKLEHLIRSKPTPISSGSRRWIRTVPGR